MAIARFYLIVYLSCTQSYMPSSVGVFFLPFVIRHQTECRESFRVMCSKAIYGVHTSQVEVLNGIIGVYCPKRVNFTPPSYETRVMIGTLRYNENVLVDHLLHLNMTTDGCRMRDGDETTEYLSTGKSRFGCYVKYVTRKKHQTHNYAYNIIEKARCIAQTRMKSSTLSFLLPATERITLKTRTGNAEEAHEKFTTRKVRQQQEAELVDEKYRTMYKDFVERQCVPFSLVHIRRGISQVHRV